MPRKEKPTLTPEAKRYFAEAGKSGGEKRWAGSTKEERRRAAQQAARARWARKKS